MIKYAYTILYVKDVEKAVQFYEKAFGFSRKFVTPENDYGELSVGETTLSFASISLANANLKDGFVESSPSSKPFGIELGFRACLGFSHLDQNGSFSASFPLFSVT